MNKSVRQKISVPVGWHHYLPMGDVDLKEEWQTGYKPETERLKAQA